MAEGRTWELRATGGERPLNLNKLAGMNRFDWARHTKSTRALWCGLAREARIPPLRRIGIEVVPLHVDGRSPQDPGACAPEEKAARDGLVDAHVIPDDNGTYVAYVKFLPPEVCGSNGMALRITEVA